MIVSKKQQKIRGVQGLANEEARQRNSNPLVDQKIIKPLHAQVDFDERPSN